MAISPLPTFETPVATKSPWNSLEVAKILMPFVSALILAVVGLLISRSIETIKQEYEITALKDNSVPRLLTRFDQFRTLGADARPAAFHVKYEPYLRVQTTDGNVLEGWPLRFSIFRNGYEFYLSPACEVSSGTARRLPGPGAIVMQAAIRRIDIIDKQTSACAAAWAEVTPKKAP